MEESLSANGYTPESDAVAGSSHGPTATIVHPAAPVPIKRPPRGSNSCVRCKGRKQRCDFEPGVTGPSKCRNCASVGAECVFTPRAGRRSKKEIGAAVSAPTLATTSPSANPINMAFHPNSTAPSPPPWAPQSLSPSAPVSEPGASFLEQHHRSMHGQGDAMQDAGSRSQSETFSPGERDAGESEDEEDGEPWSDAARGVAFLSLNASGNPIYVGPSSGFSWARVVMGGMAAAEAVQGQGSGARHFPPNVVNAALQNPAASLVSAPLADDALASVPQDVADMVLSQCYRHLQARYPFLDWLAVHEYWQNRDAIMHAASQPNASKEVRTGAFFIWMLFAIGTRLVQRVSIPGLPGPDAFYAKAMEHLEVIVGLHDLKNVQALMLMIMYSFRSSEAPSVWFLVGIVMRLCISLGLHRKLQPARARSVSPYVLQLRKRLFWSAYVLDRMMSLSLGRPTGISDRDIDIEMPLDIDCVNPNPVPSAVTGACTSLTSAIHLINLKRIESAIQKQAYRVDRPATDSPDDLLQRIDAWEAAIPAEASSPSSWNIPCVSRDYFLMRGLESRLFLLRPLTVEPDADRQHIKLLAEYAATACETHKRLHQSPTWWISLEARLRGFIQCFEDLASRVLDLIAITPNDPSNGGTANPLPLPMAMQDEFPWASLLTDMPGVMNVDFQDDYTSLLESLGIPLEQLIPSDANLGAATTEALPPPGAYLPEYANLF